ncbi:MAG: DUF2142 domain-containing protein [Oscillospiraceae bacterium]
MEQQTAVKNKLPRWLPWAIGYVAVLAAAGMLAYYWRIAFYLTQLPMLPFAGGLALVASVLYLAFFLISRFVKTISAKAALCVFALGLIFVFATAPLQVPDEGLHFLRAYSISQGHFNYDASRTYPQDVTLLVQEFPANMNHELRYGGEETELTPAHIASYQQKVESETQVTPYSEKDVIHFLLFPFLPQAALMAIARGLGFSALGILYAGRIANLALYAFISYITFKNCSKYRGVFIALALLPISLYMAASCSYDATMLALCFLALSYFCKAEIYTRDVVLFGVAVVLATYLKQNNIVLAASLLLVPKARWRTKWNPWLCTAGIAAAALLIWFVGSNYIDAGFLRVGYNPAEFPRGNGDADPKAQLLGIIKNPFAFLSRVVLTLYQEDGFLFKTGTFGWMDLSIPLISGLGLLSMGSASALGIQQKDDTRAGGAVGLGLMALLYGGAVMAGIYVMQVGVGGMMVTHLQPRYFLPAFLLLFMLGSILLGKAVRPRLADNKGGSMVRTESITLWIAAGVALVAVVCIFQSYFVGQWFPTLEGSHKLVNMLGWVNLIPAC